MSFMILAILPDKKNRKHVDMYDLLHLGFAGSTRDLHIGLLAVCHEYHECHDMVLARFVTKQAKTISNGIPALGMKLYKPRTWCLNKTAMLWSCVEGAWVARRPVEISRVSGIQFIVIVKCGHWSFNKTQHECHTTDGYMYGLLFAEASPCNRRP